MFGRRGGPESASDPSNKKNEPVNNEPKDEQRAKRNDGSAYDSGHRKGVVALIAAGLEVGCGLDRCDAGFEI